MTPGIAASTINSISIKAAVNKEERQEIIYKMQDMVYNDRPYIVLYYSNYLQAYRSDRFTNFIRSPLRA
ncbi:MAG: hypothetical protein U0X87_13345 [Anaerolineales bacterium]